ncbi:MAG: DUF1294 domain-containing protein [Chloroflexi bacterium]|nr:DUF1294 domain-containing protein [Chloroflexota bacterium]
MGWTCGECGREDGRYDFKVEVVCHHCGKLLCQKHRILIIDGAFSGKDSNSAKAGAPGQTAYHCKECKHRYHPRSGSIPEKKTTTPKSPESTPTLANLALPQKPGRKPVFSLSVWMKERSPAWMTFGLAPLIVGLFLYFYFNTILGRQFPYYLWLGIWSLVTFVLYGIDMGQSQSGGLRVPERMLHTLALVGGFAGGWAGRQLFHHKAQPGYQTFRIVLVIAAVFHGWLLLILGWR